MKMKTQFVDAGPKPVSRVGKNLTDVARGKGIEYRQRERVKFWTLVVLGFVSGFAWVHVFYYLWVRS